MSLQFRPLQSNDIDALQHWYHYQLSDQSRSRFAPHSFDGFTIENICRNLGSDGCNRFVAIDPELNTIEGYLLLKEGYAANENHRLAANGHHYPQASVYSLAPALSEKWQSKGIAQNFLQWALTQVPQRKHIVLWGGVQDGNPAAIRFYQKLGFQHAGGFWWDGIWNWDMVWHTEQLQP
ncbi:GNAT family N-acetyltransferase [Flavihumibacter rivuli]|uniref:GNAT family N-acetyltransferase n=1 Tax=Flavihumibacter rivuli TaxID=2838156 RepID=UPI001BDE994B|nr:GNAT family N-acetyltransferase [Flavihumibacter rivuli]ULQ56211.1 GNAT family N-acetyltransferase [Flavihumibacter rivuli]